MLLSSSIGFLEKSPKIPKNETGFPSPKNVQKFGALPAEGLCFNQNTKKPLGILGFWRNQLPPNGPRSRMPPIFWGFFWGSPPESVAASPKIRGVGRKTLKKAGKLRKPLVKQVFGERKSSGRKTLINTVVY